MNRLLFLAALVGVLWVYDAYAFHGRYSNALWEQAYYQAQRFNDGVWGYVRKISP